MKKRLLFALLLLAPACSAPVYRGVGQSCVGGSWSAGISASGRGPVGADDQRMMSVIDSYMGTPYVYGGTTRDGIDCSGFTQAVYGELGVEIPRTASQQAAAARQVGPASLEFGDLVFFNTSGSGISHVGIYVGEGFFVHASSSSGVRRDSLANPYYAARIVSAGRFDQQ
jgi:cell wall-associated NlpC family hydrolase